MSVKRRIPLAIAGLALVLAVAGAGQAQAAEAEPWDVGLVVLGADRAEHLVEGVRPIPQGAGLVPGDVFPWAVDVRSAGPGDAELVATLTGVSVTGTHDPDVLGAITLAGHSLTHLVEGDTVVRRTTVSDGQTVRIFVPVAMDATTTAGRAGAGTPLSISFHVHLYMHQLGETPPPAPAPGPDHHSMAPTGTAALVPLACGAALLCAGAWLLAVAKRRRTSGQRPPKPGAAPRAA